MCHIAGTSICTSPARASVADPTIVQSGLMDGHVMQRLELTARVSVHTPPSDRRPEQVPLALSKPPQYKGLHQDSPPRGRTSTVHTTTNVMAPRTLGYTLRWHNERVLNLLRSPLKCFLGLSRMETPRRELQHWSCLAPWYSPTVSCKSRARRPLQ